MKLVIALLLAAQLSDPAAFVRSLYDADQRNAPDPVYDARSREDVLRTFDTPLADLIWRDLVEADGEVGRFDGHYLYDAQDNEIRNLQVKTIEHGDGRARVVATFEFPSARMSVEFQLVRAGDGDWRIANIVYPHGDYKTYLSGSLPIAIDSEEMAAPLCAKYAEYEIQQSYDPNTDEVDLAEMFANGTDGVRKELGAAFHFVCRAGGIAPAEQWGMLDHLQRMRRGDTDEPLDFCDYATSGHGSTICALRRQDVLEPQLRERYEAVRKRHPLATLNVLRARADAFIEADATWLTEQTRGGTIYPSMEIGTRLHGEETFVDALERHSKNRLAVASEPEAKHADAELNAAYRKRLADIEPCDPEYCDPELPTETDNLRAAQRAWIPYRDAWIAYYLERWRGTASPEALRREIFTQLTRDRTAHLREH